MKNWKEGFLKNIHLYISKRQDRQRNKLILKQKQNNNNDIHIITGMEEREE